MSKKNEISTDQKFEIGRSYDDEYLLRHRPRLATINRYPPPKTTLAAITLLLVGSTLLITGFVVFFQNREGNDRGLPIFILGFISEKK
jgi:hypothetical protein